MPGSGGAPAAPSGAPTADQGNNGTTEAGTGTATSNGGPTSATDGGAVPTVNSPAPSCVPSSNYVGDNTDYLDYFGYTYYIRCSQNIQSTPTDQDAHADTFEDCLEYCSLLTDCIAVTYQDPPSLPSNTSNCHPSWDFDGYTPFVGGYIYNGVNVNGPSPGNIENQDLCSTSNEQGSSYDGEVYYDDFGVAWSIGCDTILVYSNAAALSATVTDTLASCIDYCSVYEDCSLVNWTGPHVNGTRNDPNCFPASTYGTPGAAGSTPGSGYAELISY